MFSNVFVLFRFWSLDYKVFLNSFLLLFSLTFFHFRSFFSFSSPLLPSFEPLVLLPCLTISLYCFEASSCCLELLPHALLCLVLPHHLVVPCATSSYCLIILSCCLNLLPCRLVVLHGTSNYQVASSCQVAKLP